MDEGLKPFLDSTLGKEGMAEQGHKFIESCKVACENLELWLDRCDEADIKVYFGQFVGIRRCLHEAIFEAEKIIRKEKPDEKD